MIIYNRSGEKISEVSKFQYKGIFMGESCVMADINTPMPIDLEIGCYVEYRGERYELNYTPAKTKTSGRNKSGDSFQYKGVKFTSLSDELTRCDFLDVVPKDNHIHFTNLPTFGFYAMSVKDLADRIQANLDRIYTGSKKWTVQTDPTASGKSQYVSVSKISCWEALVLANSLFDCNFVIKGRNITIGTAGLSVGKVFGYGKGKGLFTIEQQTNNNAQIITRLRAYGNTRNLPLKYYNNLTSQGGTSLIPESQYVNRVMLPGFAENGGDAYIESGNISKYGVREGTVYFDGTDKNLPDIYPSIEGMTAEDLKSAGISTSSTGALDEITGAEQITDNGEAPKEGDGEPLKSTFTINIKDIGFDINKYLSTEAATIHFRTGMCADRKFEITKCEKTDSGYTLTAKRKEDSDLGLWFPYKGFNLKSGDKFVLLNIEMPEVYIKAAEQRLLKAAKDYLAQNDESKYTYLPKIDNVFMANNPQFHDSIKEGDIFHFDDDDLGINASVIIQTLTIKEGGSVPEYEITLFNDKATSSTIDKIQNSITNLANNIGITAEQARSIANAAINAWYPQWFDQKLHTTDDVEFRSVTFSDRIKSKGAIDSMTAGKGIVMDAERGLVQADRFEARHSMTVMELIINRLSAMEGDYSFSDGGTVDRLERQEDGTYRLWLRKRWEHDFTALHINDIVYGMINTLAAGGTDYHTSWMRVLHVDMAANTADVTLYPDSEVPGGKNYPPSELMVITRRGNPADPERQGYWYLSSSEHCICMLDGVTKPILEEANYSVIVGRLKHLSIFDNLPINYRQSYVYCRGIATQDMMQIDYEGTPVRSENNRGKWSVAEATNRPYESSLSSYDAVYHYGCKWMCLKTGTTQEPRFGCTDWAMIEGNPDFTIDIESSRGWYFDADRLDTTFRVVGELYNRDVTEHILDADITWTRDTGNPTEDNAWAMAHAEAGKELHLTTADLGPDYMNQIACSFTATALLRDGQNERMTSITKNII